MHHVGFTLQTFHQIFDTFTKAKKHHIGCLETNHCGNCQTVVGPLFFQPTSFQLPLQD